jgi:hypothetical protein
MPEPWGYAIMVSVPVRGPADVEKLEKVQEAVYTVLDDIGATDAFVWFSQLAIEPVRQETMGQ